MVMKMIEFFHTSASTFFKDFNSLFDIVLVKDGIVCNDVGWWSGFNKVSFGVDNIDIDLEDITEGTGTNNQVDTSHGASIGSFVIAVGARGVL